MELLWSVEISVTLFMLDDDNLRRSDPLDFFLFSFNSEVLHLKLLYMPLQYIVKVQMGGFLKIVEDEEP